MYRRSVMSACCLNAQRGEINHLHGGSERRPSGYGRFLRATEPITQCSRSSIRTVNRPIRVNNENRKRPMSLDLIRRRACESPTPVSPTGRQLANIAHHSLYFNLMGPGDILAS